MRKKHSVFVIGKSIVSWIVKNVTEMICHHLGPKFIKLPLRENEVKQSDILLLKVYGFP